MSNTSPPSPSASPFLSPSPRTILVTGCAGFIGSHVSEFLLRRGDTVVGVDELNGAYDRQLKHLNLDLLHALSSPSAPFHFYHSDVDNEELLSSLFAHHPITSVIHLAARAGVRPSLTEPHLYTHANITATVTLLQCIQRHQPRIQHFVYASSSSVYGDVSSSEVEGSDSEPHGFVESQNTDEPVSMYAASKKSCEVIVSTFSHQYHILSSGLRFFTVYGPRGRPDMFPFLLIDSIIRRKTVKQFGDGTTSRDFTYIDDIVAGVIAVHDKRKFEGEGSRQHEIFNLGNSNPIPLKDYIAIVERIVGKKADIEIVDLQAGDVHHTYADCSKAKRMVGYEPKVSVEEGMRRTFEWYKRDYEPWRATHPQQEGTDDMHLTAQKEDGRGRSLSISTSSSSLASDRGRHSPTSHSSTATLSSRLSPPRSPRVSSHPALRTSPASPVLSSALPGLLLCSRVHCSQVADSESFLRSSSFLTNLHSWIEHAIRVATHIAIAVDSTDGRLDVASSVEDSLEMIEGGERVQLIRVAPWGKFIPALNALVQHAASLSDVTEIYFTSLEASSPIEEVVAMQKELRESQAMLVGVRLQGHEWHAEGNSSSVVPLSGVTVPWNTNGMWDAHALSRTGFLSISEDGVNGGIEEVIVIATHSVMRKANHPLAILIDFKREGGEKGSWNVRWEDAGRKAWHEAKMASKAQRAQWQLQQIGLDMAEVKVAQKTIVLN